MKKTIAIPLMLSISAACAAKPPAKPDQNVFGSYVNEYGCLSISKSPHDADFDFFTYLWGFGRPGYICTLEGSARRAVSSTNELVFELVSVTDGAVQVEKPASCTLRIHVSADRILFEDGYNECARSDVIACGFNTKLDGARFSRAGKSKRSCQDIEKSSPK